MRSDQYQDEYMRQKARDVYCGSTCDIEIDNDAKISEADDGFWVAAWVWVQKEAEE